MKKILVADREEILCFLYQEELTEEGYDVVSITSPQDLIQTVQQEQPDLLLMDIAMGKEGMWGLLKELQNYGWRVPIILCTTYAASGGFPATLIAETVRKSSNLDELKFKIRKVLRDREALLSQDTRLIENKKERRSEEQMRLFFQD